ncbi:carbohydrate sulfotransferase 11-like [Macrobrachium rosenbergii]|uniref:carbohydrate sulfotransferase 11-like n=1 Tax=Macrobrachium rosenbergii TaxID=79674 RepID=UPI0034D69B44
MMRHLCTLSPTKNKIHRLISTVGIIALIVFLHAFVTRKGDDDNPVYDNKIISEVSEDGSVSAQTTKWKKTTDKADTPQSVQMTPLLAATRSDMCVVPSKLPEVLEKRRKDAQEACERLRDELPLRWKRKDRGPSSGMLSKLRWDPKRHLVYCHLPKVASTTWAWHLLRSAGLKDEEIAAHPNVHILLRERLPPPSVEDHDNGFLKDSLAFVVSRHPFHRLVSAYKNKIIEAEKRRQHYVDLRSLILERYHHQNDLTNSTMPTFRDFCEYIADTTEDWLSDLNHKEPPDPHWMPMAYMCSPCNLHYDIYSKMETMEEDARFISAQCGLEDVIKPGAMFNPSSNAQQEEKDGGNKDDEIIGAGKLDSSLGNAEVENKTYESKENVYAKYLDELSKEEIDRLYNIYKFDFEIFGYSVDSYR